MPIGDDALSAGYPLVPETGEEGRVRWGSREFNRTRDFIAQLKVLIPIGKDNFRLASGISYGTDPPPAGTGTDGDVYFQIIS